MMNTSSQERLETLRRLVEEATVECPIYHSSNIEPPCVHVDPHCPTCLCLGTGRIPDPRLKPLLDVLRLRCWCPTKVWHQETREGGSWWDRPCHSGCKMVHSAECVCKGTSYVTRNVSGCTDDMVGGMFLSPLARMGWLMDIRADGPGFRVALRRNHVQAEDEIVRWADGASEYGESYEPGGESRNPSLALAAIAAVSEAVRALGGEA